MKLTNLPLVKSVVESGADDRLFDALLLGFPLLLVLIGVFGRTTVTVGLGATYLCVFCGHVLYKGVRL